MSMAVISYLISSPPGGRDPTLPHICVSDNVKNSTVTASSAVSGRPASAVKSPTTYGGWEPTGSTSTLTVAFGSAKSVDYIACFVRGTGLIITASYSLNGSSYTTIDSLVPETDGAIVFIFESIANVTHVRLSFSSGAPVVYNLSSGLAYITENGLSVGYAPAHLNFEDEYTNTESEGGQILGRSVVRSGVTDRLNIASVTRSWVDANWVSMRKVMRSEGVYVAWNPALYPKEVTYGMVEGNPSVSYSDPLYMDMQLTIKGPANA